MQVLLCPERIGWRNDTTKIIVLITDAPCHIAGDGILAGIWRPLEHKCSLDEDGKYSGLDYDYPSISEVNYMLSMCWTVFLCSHTLT